MFLIAQPFYLAGGRMKKYKVYFQIPIDPAFYFRNVFEIKASSFLHAVVIYQIFFQSQSQTFKQRKIKKLKAIQSANLYDKIILTIEKNSKKVITYFLFF